MSHLSHHYSVYGVAVKSDWPLAFPTTIDRTASVAEVEFVDGTDEDFSDTDAFRDPAAPRPPEVGPRGRPGARRRRGP